MTTSGDGMNMGDVSLISDGCSTQRLCKHRRRAAFYISRSTKNPGRRFFRSSSWLGDDCGYFDWCDHPLPAKERDVIVSLLGQRQESNMNITAFVPRFTETLDYYTVMFESMDVTLPRDRKERIDVEQHFLAKDVVNIELCEGAERVERHELLTKWKSRFAMARFTPYPLSTLVNATIRSLLGNYSDKYRIAERDVALYLGWMDMDLVASCAWR